MKKNIGILFCILLISSCYDKNSYRTFVSLSKLSNYENGVHKPLLIKLINEKNDTAFFIENTLLTNNFICYVAHDSKGCVFSKIIPNSIYPLYIVFSSDTITSFFSCNEMMAAKEMANEWEKLAFDGGHYRLAFDQPDSWGQKYNLIWDKLLDLNLFPEKVVELETAFYTTKLETYGCPLNSETEYAKADWTMWVAALHNDRQKFRESIFPLYKYMNENKNRVPMPDTYNVMNQKPRVTSWGRPVTGAYFIKLLEKKMNEKN